jgi:hypothetical protein
MGGASSNNNNNDKASNPNLRQGTVQFEVNKKKINKSLDDFESRNLRFYDTKKYPNIAIKGASKLLRGGYKYDLDFFTNEVLGSKRAKKNIGYTKEEFAALSPKKQDEVAKNFRDRRNAGLTDAYGNPKPRGGGGGNNNNATQMASGVVTNTGTVAAPTNAEVAQAQSTNATTMSSDEILLANKKKGRKDTIMTSASGLGESNILNTKKKTLGV